MRIVVLDSGTLGFSESEWSGISSMGELVMFEHTFPDQKLIHERCRDADVVLTNKVPLDRGTIESLPSLKLIGVLATGYNIIDVEAARSKSVTVCNVPAYGTNSVAQHTVALILELTNHVGLHADSVAKGDWIRSTHFSYMKRPIRELSDMTVGLIGFGDIGRRVGEILHCLGASILASMRTPRDAPDWERFEFASNEEIFSRADIISLHCPLTSENGGLIGRESIGKMKSDAIIINTARGGLVNEPDLLEALNSGRIGGAGLDVVSSEPMKENNPLLGAKNCWITPHNAWASTRARRRLLAETAGNLRAFVAGSPRNRVG